MVPVYQQCFQKASFTRSIEVGKVWERVHNDPRSRLNRFNKNDNWTKSTLLYSRANELFPFETSAGKNLHVTFEIRYMCISVDRAHLSKCRDGEMEV